MKKTLMLVASVAMAVVLTGCGGSKSSGDAEKGASSGSVSSARSAAEGFVGAVIKGDLQAAVACYDTLEFDELRQRTEEEKKELEAKLQDFIKFFKNKGEGENIAGTAISEVIRGGGRYVIVDGKKCTEEAKVVVQIVRNGDKQDAGVQVELVSVDGAWKIKEYKLCDGLTMNVRRARPSYSKRVEAAPKKAAEAPRK